MAYREKHVLAFLSWLFKGNPMAQVDFSSLNAELDNLAANVAKVADALNASNGAARIAELEAQVAGLQADLDASQAAEADSAAKLKASNDALAALVPPAA
jgi:hypothetical protein